MTLRQAQDERNKLELDRATLSFTSIQSFQKLKFLKSL